MYDAVIVGGGPAGCSTALNLLALGLRPLLVEKDAFPRFHIGESLTGEANQILGGMDLHGRLKDAAFIVKHGVNVFGPNGKSSFFVPTVPGSTFQVDRAVFDNMLLDEFKRRGGEVAHVTARRVIRDGKTVVGIVTKDDAGKTEEIRARVVVDASGQAAFLSREGLAGPREIGAYDKQMAVFSRVDNAALGDGDKPANWPGNVRIFYRARHHWAWLIPIKDQVVSIGVVVPSAYFQERGESPRAFLERELVELNTHLRAMLPSVELTEEARTSTNYSYRIRDFTGPGFLAVGDAHRFVDPIFSFGVHIGLTEGRFAAQAIAAALAGPEPKDGENPYRAYEEMVDKGQQVFEDLIHFFWRYPLQFLRYIEGKHRDDLIEIFAGRVYGPPSVGLQAFRELLAEPMGEYATPGAMHLGAR